VLDIIRQPTRRRLYLAGSRRFSKPRYANLVAEKIARNYMEQVTGMDEYDHAMSIIESLTGHATSVEGAIFLTLRKLERNFTKDELHYMTRLQRYTTQRAVFESWVAASRSTVPQHETTYDESDTIKRKRRAHPRETQSAQLDLF